MDFDIIVIGAGAAGLIAAGRAAQQGASVVVVERNRQAGRKLLITGKGRCNITNTAPRSEHFKNIFPSPRFLKHAYATFFADDILALLNGEGVPTVIERGNRAFPESNQSEDVRNALQQWAQRQGVTFLFETQAEKIITEEGRLTGLRVQDLHGTRSISCMAAILCAGGRSYPATGSDGSGFRLARDAGHTIVPLRPALVPLETAGTLAGRLQGLSLKNANAVLWVNGKKQAEAFGELLFTHFGLSGPVILTLSRAVVDALTAGHKAEISIDLKPALEEPKLDQRLVRDLNENGKKRLENVFKLWLPSKMVPVFLEELGIDGNKPANQMEAAARRKAMLMMKNLRFSISGNRSFKEAVITAGGVSTGEIQSKSMESKLVTGLYFAGEVIDLDANTGGYNLQIAWSTGWLAGQSAADSLTNAAG
jgi:predicted Rossmann fold flavoprotein